MPPFSSQTLSFLAEKARRIRIHCLRSTSEAGSGHPTSCLSAAEVVSALFFHVMRYDPENPQHPHNDRFVLSKGHAAPVLYAACAEVGILPPEKLLTLRKFHSELEGHPTPRFPWVAAATGSLGQGLSIGAGMALSGKYLDRLPYRVYVLMGDGEVAEGSVWEAVEIAAHYQLDNLIGIVDVNGLGQSQRTLWGFDLEAYCRRFSAFGWHAFGVDGHNLAEILSAFEEAETVQGRPVVIVARTLKGKGVSFLEDREGWHGKALKKGEELERALKELGWEEGDFEKRSPFKSSLPPPAPIPSPIHFDPPLPSYKIGDKVATRAAYGAALARLGEVHPLVVSLDGDTKNSTFAEKFLEAHPDRYFEGFIAEQNMVGMAVGLATCGKIPFVSTFAAFLTRAYDQIRMAAISRVNIKYAGSHCGVSIGEDGPSQMGLEDLAMMRAVPRCVVLYPADAVSTAKLVMEAARHLGPIYLRLSRPPTPVLYSNHERFPIGGCKVVRSSPRDRMTVVAAGVTLHEALKAHETLCREGLSIRVLDAYSVKPLAAQTIIEAARQTASTLVVVEDHYPEGGLGEAVLEAVAPYGVRVHKMAVGDIPRSGKPEELLEAYGISAACIVRKVRELAS